MSENSHETGGGTPLDDLRREIDRIDDNLHDLLMERAQIVEKVAAVKGEEGLTVIHPGREIAILRRLAGRHGGRLPIGVIARMWREMLSGTVFMQGPFSVAVYADGDNQGVWDLARDQFGSHSEMTAHSSPREVLHQVMTGAVTVGVLPAPAEHDPDHWWLLLCLANAPRVFSKLPFAGPGNARGPQHEALAVGQIRPVATGDDRTVIVLETREAFSRDGLGELLRGAGLEPVKLVSTRTGSWMHLAEVASFVGEDDPRLAALQARDDVLRTVWVGAYGMPLVVAAVATPAGANA